MASMTSSFEQVAGQVMVDEYVRLSAQIKSAEERMKQLRPGLLEVIRSSGCPSDGPFVIRLVTQERSKNGWKEICERVLTGICDEDERKRAEARRDHALEARNTVELLVMQPNAEWRKS